MMQRAPHSPMAGTGWLEGWRLTFGGEDFGWEGALATIVEDAGSRVFVVLYDMTPQDEEGLDRWEGGELGMHNKLPATPVAASSGTAAQTNTPPPSEGHTPTERLQVLKQLFDQKLITQEEYDRKKAEIIKSM